MQGLAEETLYEILGNVLSQDFEALRATCKVFRGRLSQDIYWRWHAKCFGIAIIHGDAKESCRSHYDFKYFRLWQFVDLIPGVRIAEHISKKSFIKSCFRKLLSALYRKKLECSFWQGGIVLTLRSGNNYISIYLEAEYRLNSVFVDGNSYLSRQREGETVYYKYINIPPKPDNRNLTRILATIADVFVRGI